MLGTANVKVRPVKLAMLVDPILVFSTLRETLSKKEMTSLSRLAKAGRKYWKGDGPINPVVILTGTELLEGNAPVLLARGAAAVPARARPLWSLRRYAADLPWAFFVAQRLEQGPGAQESPSQGT